MKNIHSLLKNIKNKKLLVVFPHPDDESFATGGLLICAKKMGFETHILTLTKGGAGRISINPKGKSLKEVRSIELKKSSSVLGVDELILKDFDDGKLKTRNGWNKVVKKEIQRIKPGVIVTYDPSGMTGHPDHIRVALKLKEIVGKIRFKSKPVLLWTSFYPNVVRKFIPSDVRDFLTVAHYENNMTLFESVTKIRAMTCHKSQRYDNLLAILAGVLIVKKEWYHRVDLKKNYPYKYMNFKI